MGEVLKTSLEQGFFETFRSAKELSLALDNVNVEKFKNHIGVKNSCSLDQLARLTSKCKGMTNEQLIVSS